MQRVVRNPLLHLADFSPELCDIRDDALAGLTCTPKTLPCRLLYDAAGAALFEQICRLPEYYPTRTEIGILLDNCADIARQIGSRGRLIELGSGSAVKTRILLQHVQPAEYVPIDISRAQLIESAQAIAHAYPGIRVRPVCADYTTPFRLPEPASVVRQSVIFFPGSTIGNFEPLEAARFLAGAARLAGRRSGLLIGVDLQKDPLLIERAYNDAQGATALFNLNVLARLNRELGADFNTAAFRHKAVYNRAAHRIEMHLISRYSQSVAFPLLAHFVEQLVRLAEAESIVTEHSYKYSIPGFTRLAASAGWELKRVWMDAEQLFAVLFLARAG